MLKSNVSDLSRVYDALFRDASYAYPTLTAEFEKDRRRLHLMYEHRGDHLYLEDLPAAGKHLDRCLSSGAYKLIGLPLTKAVSKRVRIPKFLRGLYLRVFTDEGWLKEEPDVQAITFLRQILFVAKKAVVPCDPSRVMAEIQSFLKTDAELPEVSDFWVDPYVDVGNLCGMRFQTAYTRMSRGQVPRPTRQVDQLMVQPPDEGASTDLLRNLDIVSGLLCSAIGPYQWPEWRFSHGPGAVSDRPRYTSKYAWVSWPERLERVYPIADCGFHNYQSWVDWTRSCEEQGLDLCKEVEPASKLIAVPKSWDKPRLIAAEPTAHMWCQQNVKHYFYERVPRTWIGQFIKFDDQTLNQELCVRGSADGSLMTIDLSSASDRVSCLAVECLFSRNLSVLEALRATRTRFIDWEDPREESRESTPNRWELRKFSTMGNACTFPVESLMFLAVTLSATLTALKMEPTLQNISALAGRVSVYGDDIIAPTESRELLCELLEILDFKVNLGKSFTEGNFRESCGVDAFRGDLITPAYWRDSHDGTPDGYARCVTMSNNFYRKFLVHTSNYALSTVRRVQVPTVYCRSGALGAISFVDPLSQPFLKRRWNEDLQREEAYVPVLVTKQDKAALRDPSALLQYFTEEPPPDQPWSSGVAQKPKSRIRLRWVACLDLSAQ